MHDMHGKRVVVLGGAGFLGSHLCDRVLADGAAHVTCVDSFLTGAPENVLHLQGAARFGLLQHDITLPFEVPGEVDFVFNLASPASPIDYAQIPLETLRVGARGTEHALELARRKRAVFVQASTSEVYGDPLVHPQREDYWGHVNPVGPRSCYDEAKRYAEALCAAYERVHGVSVRLGRIFNTYGPRMRLSDGRVVPAFLSQVLAGRPLTVFGDGSQTRSFCYVSDLVDGLVRLARSDVRGPVNLGNPAEFTILELAHVVLQLSGTDLPLSHEPLPRDDPRQRRPDISRARELLGWSPTVTLEEGLRRTLAYFQTVALAGSRS